MNCKCIIKFMSKEYYICILDFEATCFFGTRNDKTREIIEFSSILINVNSENKICHISQFSQYVKPSINPILSDFCIKLTGITQNQITNAKNIKDVYKEHCKWLTEHVQFNQNFLFLTVGKWDLETMLPIEAQRYNIKLNNYYKKWKNLKEEFEIFYNKNAGTMMEMLEKLKITHTGHYHSGISDCENILKIVEKMIHEGHNFFQN